MNSLRSELCELVTDLRCRPRDSLLRGLSLIFMTIISAMFGALACEYGAKNFPDAQIIFRLLGVFWIGTRMRALGNMLHECSHGIFVREASHNAIFGQCLSIIDLCSYPAYCKQHATHHAHLGDPELDLDLRSRFPLLMPRKKNNSIWFILLYAVFLVPLWLVMMRPIFWDRQSPFWSNCARLVFVAALTSALASSSTRFYVVLYWFIPYITSYQWMRIFSDACDHLYLTNSENILERSRNHLFKRQWVNSVLFPRHDGFHLIHHLFPAMPTRFYPEIHGRLLTNPWYARRKHFLINGSNRKSLCSKMPVTFHGQSK